MKKYQCFHCHAEYRPQDEKCPRCGAYETKLMRQIQACKQEVANWPAWMKQTSVAPNWMGKWGWDD